MSQFGLGLGVITVVVIGGAIVLDRTTDDAPKTAQVPAKPQAMVTETNTPAPSTVASVDGNGGSSAVLASNAPVEKSSARVAVDKPARSAPAEKAPSRVAVDATPRAAVAPSAPATPARPSRSEATLLSAAPSAPAVDTTTSPSIASAPPVIAAAPAPVQQPAAEQRANSVSDAPAQATSSSAIATKEE